MPERLAETNFRFGCYRNPYAAWCAAHGFMPVPAAPATVGAYLASLKDSHAPATVRRRLAAIGKMHRFNDLPWNSAHRDIAGPLGGLLGERGRPARKAAALSLAMLRQLVATCDGSNRGRRERALLLIGFASVLRRSELVALRVEDVALVATGLRVRIRGGKTDAAGEGAEIGLPRGRHAETCPMRALEAWQAVAKRKAGPLFRRVSAADRIGDTALHPDAVRRIMAHRVGMAGLAVDGFERLSAHALRGGFHHGSLRQGRARRGHHAPHPPPRSAHHARLRPARRPAQREPGRDDRPLTAVFRTPWEADPPPAAAPTLLPPVVADPKPRGRRPAPSRQGPAPARPAWLYHHLTITGPAAATAEFAAAARGPGVIPWWIDGAALEEDVFNLAVAQPLGRRTLDVAGCRILARQFRKRVEARQARAAALVGHGRTGAVCQAGAASQACPFDLHTLLPVPDAILRQGPTHPAALAWLAAHWGVGDGLRHVAERPNPRPGRWLPRDHAAIGYGFFTGGDTPDAAIAQLASRWPALRLMLQPRPD